MTCSLKSVRSSWLSRWQTRIARATWFAGRSGLSARDAVHAAVMLNNDVEWIATFDSGFDGIPGIRRMKLS